MRTAFLTLTFLFTLVQAKAQFFSEPEEVVIAFFNAFHQQDTLAMRELVHSRIKMQSLGVKNEEVRLSTTTFEDFLKSIASIPDNMVFEERILDYKTQSDGQMANVWTPYEFYINEELSHCGANSFQMLFEEDRWKIFYIVDTRRREGCE
ncbi:MULTISPECIES: nuclear transport factor 2 family protein [unclassified Leeuwenhoekiella]|uniref:nuclear transport factor 2 family protein n=1 Tax=unclassified Leeuwenhoekiella TaxID=2615029 RepID=UPI000C3AE7AF|nr:MULTISPECIES: nuclear transport factor 2 family protein [unclassified Leeuwenhoekiella]MAW94989.1 3-methyl-2-oxobutanoate hydroxymethyltransferase [Leeuwenhoekiella sp.]MBA79709.1 3-methyl-2-oxobutanoate hydroxymethyltransferase [Leeuwenhoekiella sp.]|tara:strand:+ start:6889 stop:7338 length:450 start_codon:yes stop_codon:yes gene_type:complete